MVERKYSSVAAPSALTAPVNGVATSFALSSVAGLPVSYPFTLVVDPGTESEEIVTVTALSGSTATVIRGEDGTSGLSHTSGAVVRHMMTGRDLREAQQHINATSGVHGVTTPLAQLVPTGVLLPYAGDTTAPDGFLLADGAAVSRSEYADLFAVLGTTWGGGDGSTTFNLPDMRERVPQGATGNTGTHVGDYLGSKHLTLTTANIPAHNHTFTTASAGAHTHTGTANAAGAHTHTSSNNAAHSTLR